MSTELAVQVLERSHFLDWRVYNFLEHPNTPRDLVWSQASLWFHLPNSAIPESYGTGVHVHAANEEALQRATEQMDVRVLRIQNMQPGSFTSFATQAQNARFNTWFQQMMNDMKWCCTTQVQALKQRRFDSIDFPLPAPLNVTKPPHFEVSVPCQTTMVDICISVSKPAGRC